jgi:Beta-lactamase enzyme family
VPAALPPPELVAPAPDEVSSGRVAGRIPRGTKLVRVSVGGRLLAEKTVGRSRFDFTVELPPRDVTLRVTAVDGRGRRSSTAVGPVFGLPSGARPRGPPSSGHEDAPLAGVIRGLARDFPGVCGIFVQDLRTGAGAAWNARAAFPAASTLKVAIAIQVLIAHRGRPPSGSRLDRLLRQMLVPSQDKPANELLTWLGGSTSGGAARVNATLRALGLWDTEMYGGYIVPARRPIPLRADQQPSFIGKRTTAWDFGRLLRYLHLAADGQGLLAQRFRGSFVPADARFLLYLLTHARPNWLARYLPGAAATAHKPGWITRARHDAGLVYWRRGAYVAVVLTWNGRGVGAASELLAGRVGRAAFDRFAQLAKDSRDVGARQHRFGMAFDEELGVEREHLGMERQRALRRDAAVRALIEAVAEEEHAVRFDEHDAGVGRVVAADVAHPDGDAAELEVESFLEDDVGWGDTNFPWSRELLLDVRGVGGAGFACGHAPVERLVAPVHGRELDQGRRRQAVCDHTRVERGRADDVIPVRVREDDVARRRDSFRRQRLEEADGVGGRGACVEPSRSPRPDDRAQ